jgi:hypothetical protein
MLCKINFGTENKGRFCVSVCLYGGTQEILSKFGIGCIEKVLREIFLFNRYLFPCMRWSWNQMHQKPGLMRDFHVTYNLRPDTFLFERLFLVCEYLKKREKGNLGNLLLFTVIMNTSCARAFTCCAGHNKQADKYVQNKNYERNCHMSIRLQLEARGTHAARGPQPYFQFMHYKNYTII